MLLVFKRYFPRSIRDALHLFLAWWGSIYYGHPSEQLLVIGVTGTSGKSSTIHFLRQILEHAGFTVGSLSTVDFYIAGKETLNDQKMTMLGRMQIQKYLREMVSAGCDIAIIETTSEGYVQHRHRFINYDTIVLTNLYPEHIESHGSFEKYKAAKLGIFRYVAGCGRKKFESGIRNLPTGQAGQESGGCIDISKTAVVNSASEYAEEFLSFDFGKKIKFLAQGVQNDANGISFSADGHTFRAPIYGVHHAHNIAAAIAVARTLAVPVETIADAVQTLKPPPGRQEFIREAETLGFKAIVDYAFEPVAMKALYDMVDMLHPKKIIHVFGSTGGGRDVARRGTVGKFVGEHADTCIITNEDPYDDDPIAIMDDILRAVQSAGKRDGETLFKILDRKEAIAKAISLARQGDVVLVTGKGSEQGMVIRGTIVPWDDRVIVRECLKGRKS